MGNYINSKDLSRLGYKNNKAKSLAITIFNKHFKFYTKEDQLEILADIIVHPEKYLSDELTSKIAAEFMPNKKVTNFTVYDLLEKPVELQIYGKNGIDELAIKQIEIASSLPISVKAALMPDAHAGFGLPIGGVLATHNSVIPYAVGMDIGCKMELSILDATDSFLDRYQFQIKTALKNNTHFGIEGGLPLKQDHQIMDDELFYQLPFLKQLHGKAYRQLGSSGSGNHFVELGSIKMHEGNSLGLKSGNYMALLSHSGSRGLGAAIASHFTKIAQDTCKLPKSAQQLAWLDLESEAGELYWKCMNLASSYAGACHELIHQNITKNLGLQVIAHVENAHNLAWKSDLEGKEVIIHRKGATPAHLNQLGIIPGSMASSAFLVRGKGNPNSLFSASHGAGRAMSRQQAKNMVTVSAMKKMLDKAGVHLIGGSVDENPNAYKNIHQVMAAQKQLVDIEGEFFPSVVRMHKE